jgi:hypothetical protein
MDSTLQQYAELMAKIGSPVELDHYNQRLEELMKSPHWHDWYSKLLDKDERRCVRYYRNHRNGDCTYCPSWTPKIESAIAKIEAERERVRSLRWVVRDKKTELYWASLGSKAFWVKTTRNCFIFTDDSLNWIEDLVTISNKKIGQRRFELVQIDASKRLKKSAI